MPNEMKNYNKPPTPKQKKLWLKLTDIADPMDISCEGGMSMAITIVIGYKAQKANTNVMRILLPAGCFCAEFTAKGIPKLNTIADKKYNNGMVISKLGKPVSRFSRRAQGKSKLLSKHIEATQLKRPRLELTRPVLEPMPRIRRV